MVHCAILSDLLPQAGEAELSKVRSELQQLHKSYQAQMDKNARLEAQIKTLGQQQAVAAKQANQVSGNNSQTREKVDNNSNNSKGSSNNNNQRAHPERPQLAQKNGGPRGLESKHQYQTS
jgi:septal ring factor EnvC (AmiA/AmiB activator)